MGTWKLIVLQRCAKESKEAKMGRVESCSRSHTTVNDMGNTPERDSQLEMMVALFEEPPISRSKNMDEQRAGVECATFRHRQQIWHRINGAQCCDTLGR